jgi:hypothetical protein
MDANLRFPDFLIWYENLQIREIRQEPRVPVHEKNTPCNIILSIIS